MPPNLTEAALGSLRSSWFRGNGRMPVNLGRRYTFSGRQRLTVGF
ncbi:hypothetical protein [Paenibacillus macquariensis]|nr:hypothetical protein [Paenibacillus macquariensis]MEC0091573.1 hypothetical protein [Paenibacillus macquariensis]